MKSLIQICRYLLAVTFIFSGFVKGIDPLGTAYKLHDYFMAFGMDWLNPTTTTFAFILCASEFAIGLLLFFGAGQKLAAWGVFLYMLVFTPLTLYLAIANPVSDCGCFGDAIILSNWQTFYKNIVFLLAAIILFTNRQNLVCQHSATWDFCVTILLIIFSFIPSIHGYNNLPAIDFRPYSVGTNLRDAMAVPADAPADVYKTTLFYQKDGVTKEFDESNYPWQDSTWQFVDSKSELVKRGYIPEIHDFALISSDGIEITDSITHRNGYTFLVVAKRLDEMSENGTKALIKLRDKAKNAGIELICATASPAADINKFIYNNGPTNFVSGDETMLKTIIRANPGVLLIYDGTIVGKWHWSNIPNFDLQDKNILAQAVEFQQKKQSNTLTAALVILLFAVLFLFKPNKRR